MGALKWEGPRIGDDVEVDGIQPGGGFCIGLEGLWGRWRRFWLRSFRARYVAEMQSKRQGDCPACPHNIIDPRDLKLVRNVCGFWFREEDDAFRWRERIGLSRTGLAEVVFSSLVALASLAAIAAFAAPHLPLIWLATIPIAFIWYHAIRFFRDPKREAPQDSDLLISPSDGVVTDLHEIEDPDFPGGRAFRVSIYLSPWDVHLNRNPRSATVSSVRYFPGKFHNARHKDCAMQNEQLWVDLHDDKGRTLRIKQISGAMARRLVCWLKVGDTVRVGDRYGMIKYGSRADVLIPADSKFSVDIGVGDRVRAGETILLRFTDE